MKLLKSRFQQIIKAALNSAILCAALAISLAVNFSHAATNDLNGDGKSDLIFRNDSTGQINAWLMNGAAAASTAGFVGPGAWTVTHVADFNGDGRADILFRNDDGTVALWLMNGITNIGNVILLGAATGWTVTHVGDFNGDGKADILWRNTDGSVALWLMNGTTVLSAVGIFGADPNWRVTHVADFNGDGKADLLWRHTDDTVVMWLMNGAAQTSSASLLGANSGWRVSHTADFNGDGRADLLWRNNDGAVAMWLMNGTVLSSGGGILGAQADWRVTHTADFNGDGRADLLWRKTDGTVAMWLMNGITQQSGGGNLLGATADWRVTHTADFNGDGKADVVWRHTDGTMAIWQLNGLASIAQTVILGATPWRIVPPYVEPTAAPTEPSGASPKVFYIHADHLGTPRTITRSTDNVKVWEWENTEAFGNSAPNENPSALGNFKYNLRMPGQYWDQETGTFYNYFRDYDPSLGRYVQSDPIGLAGGASIYGYVGSSPLAFFDPFGLEPVIPNPNNVVPGGPWTPHDANRPGQFLGPKPSDGHGGRPQCQYVPPEGEGGPPGSRGYWKTNQPGQSGWQRYNFEGKPITAQEAHRIPTPRPPGNSGGAAPPPAMGIGAATVMVGILALLTPGNVGQCKSPCECGEMCPKPAGGASQ